MKLINNILLKSKHNNRDFLADIRYIPNSKPKPVILFVHGLKGFKDWGHWGLIADSFTNEGFVFTKINLSHNGTTPDHPTEFVDLEAFADNNYSIELDDIGVFIDHLYSDDFVVPLSELDLNKLFIIGHSRGGGLAILKAYEDKRVKALATWASVDDYGARWNESELEEWKKMG